jgi:hypothetical protein
LEINLKHVLLLTSRCSNEAFKIFNI